MTPEKRKKLVGELLDGEKWMILDTEEKIRFGAGLLFMGLPKTFDITKIGMVLGDLSQTIGDRTCNGIPMFGSARFVLKEDWSLIVKEYNEKLRKIQEIKAT